MDSDAGEAGEAGDSGAEAKTLRPFSRSTVGTAFERRARHQGSGARDERGAEDRRAPRYLLLVVYTHCRRDPQYLRRTKIKRLSEWRPRDQHGTIGARDDDHPLSGGQTGDVDDDLCVGRDARHDRSSRAPIGGCGCAVTVTVTVTRAMRGLGLRMTSVSKEGWREPSERYQARANRALPVSVASSARPRMRSSCAVSVRSATRLRPTDPLWPMRPTPRPACAPATNVATAI